MCKHYTMPINSEYCFAFRLRGSASHEILKNIEKGIRTLKISPYCMKSPEWSVQLDKVSMVLSFCARICALYHMTIPSFYVASRVVKRAWGGAELFTVCHGTGWIWLTIWQWKRLKISASRYVPGTLVIIMGWMVLYRSQYLGNL